MVQTITLGYLVIYLENGVVKVDLAHNLNSPVVQIVSHTGNLNDGSDHKLEVVVSRFSNSLTLIINEDEERSVDAGIHAQPLDQVVHICMGGLSPKVLQVYKNSELQSFLRTALDFRGCLIEPMVNSKDITGPSFLHNVIYGCLPPLPEAPV